MSVEIINLFTSSKNIEYLKYYLSNNIKNEKIKDTILSTITERVFEFPCNELLDDSRSHLRYSTKTWKEVRNLNQKFIENRMNFANSIQSIGIEDYAHEMIYNDSIYPVGYEHLNNSLSEDPVMTKQRDSRIFRYQDPYNINRSVIPIQQKVGHNMISTQEPSDELRGSYYSQIRSASKKTIHDHIFNAPDFVEEYKWFEL